VPPDDRESAAERVRTQQSARLRHPRAAIPVSTDAPVEPSIDIDLELLG
jgi:hypothetical protein